MWDGVRADNAHWKLAENLGGASVKQGMNNDTVTGLKASARETARGCDQRLARRSDVVNQHRISPGVGRDVGEDDSHVPVARPGLAQHEMRGTGQFGDFPNPLFAFDIGADDDRIFDIGLDPVRGRRGGVDDPRGNRIVDRRAKGTPLAG